MFHENDKKKMIKCKNFFGKISQKFEQIERLFTYQIPNLPLLIYLYGIKAIGLKLKSTFFSQSYCLCLSLMRYTDIHTMNWVYNSFFSFFSCAAVHISVRLSFSNALCSFDNDIVRFEKNVPINLREKKQA